ncbi:hypothetical protein BB8028_0010g00280 [Beauveria bassiana]|uniref:Uncharacterized protein n=1 Tax=Beauveria bassiana TaxID=176275 RepID=A0A2S7YPQ1_BEABA|nr:hypothetical protein BB8028_0010g00280 [Beauveria bassiana]
MESTEFVNEVLEAAFRLAASEKKHLLWEIVVRAGDYSLHKAEILEAASEVLEPSWSSQEPLEVSGLQPRFGDFDMCLRKMLSSITNSAYLTSDQLGTIATSVKKPDCSSLAISEIACRCYQYGLQPPKGPVRKGDLPGLLWGILIWGKAIQRSNSREISLPSHLRDRPTPEPWTAEEVEDCLAN